MRMAAPRVYLNEVYPYILCIVIPVEHTYTGDRDEGLGEAHRITDSTTRARQRHTGSGLPEAVQHDITKHHQYMY